MESLRNEIIETQKVRSELLKWKLLVIAGLGAAAIGLDPEPFHKDQWNSRALLLCLVPLACSYVDLQCRHLSMRIKVIGEFIRTQGEGIQQRYEEFYTKTTRNQVQGFGLESVALVGSTLGINLLLLLFFLSAVLKSSLHWSSLLFFFFAFLLSLKLTRSTEREFLTFKDRLSPPTEPPSGFYKAYRSFVGVTSVITPSASAPTRSAPANAPNT